MVLYVAFTFFGVGLPQDEGGDGDVFYWLVDNYSPNKFPFSFLCQLVKLVFILYSVLDEEESKVWFGKQSKNRVK